MKKDIPKKKDFVVKSTIAKRNEQLSEAAEKGNIKAIIQLLETKININNTSGSKHGSTPLALACYRKHYEIVKTLIKAGADTNKRTKNGNTPLLVICDTYEGDSEMIVKIVKILLEAGAKPNLTKKNGESPLTYSAMYGYGKAVKLLIEHGANVNAKGGYGRTALIYAASDGSSTEIVQMLLDAKANIKAKNEAGENALFELITREGSNREVAELLIDSGLDINIESKHYGTALHWAAFCGRKNIVELLLEKDAKINGKDKDGNLPITRAMSQGKDDVVKFLFEKGAHSNSTNNIFGWSLLEYAVENGDNNFVKQIIEKSKKENIPLATGALAEA